MKILKKIKKKVKEFFSDEYGGNIVEYILLIAFAVLLFFIIIAIVLHIIDTSTGQVWELDKWWANQTKSFYGLSY